MSSPSPSQPTGTTPASTHFLQSHPTTPTLLTTLFLSSIATKNTTQMRALIHPEATAVLIRDNIPRFQSLENTIVTLERFQGELVERIWGGGEVVDVEGVDDSGVKGNGKGKEESGFATVWTRFGIERDGELYQLGTSAYSCWKDPEKGWVILSMADIARVQPDWKGKA